MLLTLRLLDSAGAAHAALAQGRLRHPRQFQRERRALVFALALGEHAAAVLLDDRAHDVEAEAGALDLGAAAAGSGKSD